MAPAMWLGSEIQPEAKGNSNDNAYAINQFVISAVTCTVLPFFERANKLFESAQFMIMQKFC